jgi:hypothetical protein
MHTPDLSAQNIEDTFFGSGFDMYSWWESVSLKSRVIQDGEAITWEWEVTGENPNEDGSITKVITPDVMLDVIGRIHMSGNAMPYVSPYTIAECGNFLYGFEPVDFDADTADQVMQVAVFGAVHYG